MGKFTQYKIELASLSEGKHSYDFVCDTEFFHNMEATQVKQADVAVHLDLDHRHDSYRMHFTLRGEMQLPCDRCLDPLALPVDTTYDITVRYGDDYDDTADDVLQIPYADTSLNVAYMLYDTLMLTIPMKHVHPQGQCNKAMAATLNRHMTGDPETDEALDQEEIETDNNIEK